LTRRESNKNVSATPLDNQLPFCYYIRVDNYAPAHSLKLKSLDNSDHQASNEVALYPLKNKPLPHSRNGTPATPTIPATCALFTKQPGGIPPPPPKNYLFSPLPTRTSRKNRAASSGGVGLI